MTDIRARLWSKSDGIVALGVFAVVFAAGHLAASGFTRAGNLPQYYQGQFGPAALMACGHGFVNPPGPPLAAGESAPGFEALTAFLAQQRDSLDCRDIPASFTGAPLQVWQGTYRYLLVSAAAVWRVTGVSWPALSNLAAILAAVSAALVYLLARTSMGRVLALVMTALLIASPLQLWQLPHLRDYAKAPFFMFTLCAVAWITLTRASRGRTAAVLAGVGAVLGIGFGFRTDVVSYLPFVLLAVLAFRPGFDRTDFVTRGAAAASAVIAFLIVASPILKAYQSGDTVAHWAVLGLSEPSRDSLGLREAPYSYGYFYDDSYVALMIAGYSDRLAALHGPVLLGTPEYTTWGNQYYKSLLGTFPGDILIRAWAAVAAVFQLPFRQTNATRPDWIDPSWDPIFRLRAALLSWLGVVPPLVAATTLMIGTGVVSTRLLGLLVLFGIIVPGMTALQFHERHVFHLEVLPLFFYGCLLHSAWRLLRHRPMRQPFLTPASAVTALLVAFGMTTIVAVPVIAARSYQTNSVTKLFTDYEGAELERIEAPALPQPDGQLLLPVLLNASEQPAHFIDTNVLSLRVSGDHCDVDRLFLNLRYRATPLGDFTQRTIVPVPRPGEGASRLIFPVYTTGARSGVSDAMRFVGVEMAPADQPCIQSFSRFTHPEKFSLLFESVLLPDWRERRRYETLRDWESSSGDWRVADYSIPADLRLGRQWLSQLRPEDSRTTYRSRQVRSIDAHAIEIRGRAKTDSEYILTWPYQSRPQGSVFVVEGELFEGGLTVGIQQSERWVHRVNVLSPGRFRAALRVEEPGEYGAVLANLMLTGRHAHTTITRYGWLPPEPVSVTIDR